MTIKIKTTDLLELLAKVGELDLSIFVKQDKDGNYVVKFYELYTNNFDERVIITKEEEEKLKEQKRKELLTRLTDEEKELLGVK
jgi:hypothetical protein